MTHSPPRLGFAAWLVLLAFAAFLAPEARSQTRKPARQVTVFGIVASPNDSAIDPKLKTIAPQLRKLLPNHGFRLLDVQTKRLVAGQAVTCKLGGGFTASTALVQPLDEDGKVELQCEVLQNSVSQHATRVATPPNQLFFLDQEREDGSHVLIGVGAR